MQVVLRQLGREKEPYARLFPVLWQPPAIAPVDPQIAAGIRAVIDGKAKPPGSLGRIEDLALQLGMIRHPGEPRGDNAVLLVFAGITDS